MWRLLKEEAVRIERKKISDRRPTYAAIHVLLREAYRRESAGLDEVLT